MSDEDARLAAREAFGPNLRRLRLQRGVSLEQLAESTKVSKSLWAGLERNDLSRWPSGIYARAYLRDYARAIGVDPESTVDEFCRCFPHGDRRLGRTVREHAFIVEHNSEWQDEVPATVIEGDRRRSPSTRLAPAASPATGVLVQVAQRLRRAFSRA